MTKAMALSFALAVAVVFSMIAVLWLADILNQTPQIPAQIPSGNFVEMLLNKKKHNPIDDFPLTSPITQTWAWEGSR